MKNINKYRLIIFVSAIFAVSFASIIALTVAVSSAPTRPPPDLVSRWSGENNASNTQLNVNPSLSTECTLSFVTSPSFFAGNGPVSITKGDFNGDGKIDLATANYHTGNVEILLGNDNGTFQSPVRWSGKGNVLPNRPPLRTGRATFTASRLKPFTMFLLKNTALLLSVLGNELDDDNLDAVTPYFQKYRFRHQIFVEGDEYASLFAWLFYFHKSGNFHPG